MKQDFYFWRFISFHDHSLDNKIRLCKYFDSIKIPKVNNFEKIILNYYCNSRILTFDINGQMEETRLGVCSSYEPHVWRRNKCKNCFHSKSEHKKALKTQQSFILIPNGRNHHDDTAQHLDYIDVSDPEMTPRYLEAENSSRKDYREELKLLRRERKEIANKQAELRETMLRMEVQMHDYKETKQENDILTKDIQLMKKDLREVTQGASKACEMNEKLRKEVSRLRQMVRDLGGDPKKLDSSIQYDSESTHEDFTTVDIPRTNEAPLSVESEPEVSSHRIQKKKRRTLTQQNDNVLASQNKVQPTPLSRSVRERMARMEELLSSLRSVCISITNTPPNVSVADFFVFCFF